MNKGFLAALGMASALALAAPAFAQGAGGGAMMAALQAADVNKDGKYSKQEWFNLRDQNKDGSVTADELGQMGAAAMALDADKNGKLSLAEYTGPNSRFAKADTNNDGSLDQAELMAMFAAMRPPS